MADIELVIKIDEKYLEDIKKCVKAGDIDYEPWVAIANGIPLPKEHGDIMDSDVLCEKYEMTYDVYQAFDLTPVLIEANYEENKE